MYITLTGIQSGELVYHEWNLPVSADGTSACHAPEAALCELTYYHRWENISAALGNNEVSTKDSTTSIMDEYYNVCELDEEVFQPLGAEQFACANQSLTAVCEEASSLKQPAGPTLGILPSHIRVRQNIYCRRATQTSHPSGNICTPGEMSTSENLHNGRRSTLLRSVPVENERCGGGRTEAYPVLQYKRLALGANPQLTLTVLDANGKKLMLDYLSATLLIRNG